jgi:hypothetical protein
MPRELSAEIRLSGYQAAWLVALLEVTEWCERTGWPRPNHKHWGVKLPNKRAPRGRRALPRSYSAARSRALRRLEERAFLLRNNNISDGRRATHLKLTDVGRALAERLRADGTPRIPPVNTAQMVRVNGWGTGADLRKSTEEPVNTAQIARVNGSDGGGGS